MPEVREVVVSASAKINVGDYQSTDFFLSLRADVDELEDPAEAVVSLQATVDGLLCAQLLRAYRKMGKKVDPVAVAKRHGL